MIEQPEGFIESQPQIEPPLVNDGTLMDDTVVLMDDPSALMGGQVAISPNIDISVTVTKPQGK